MKLFKLNKFRWSMVAALIFACACREPQMVEEQTSDVVVVEGLHYADSTPVRVSIEKGVIRELVSIPELDESGNQFLAPGFIDLQINGYLSHSFGDPQLQPEDFREILEALWQRGITTILPTLTSQTRENLLESFRNLHQILQDTSLARSVPGFHLEGPFISPEPGYRGVHNPQWIRHPDWEEFQDWQRASGNRILVLTMAPELEGAMEFIDRCRQQSLVVALGHTAAGSEAINQAVDRGASLSTHLGNGCANSIHRHHNPLWPQLAHDGLAASIIADGFHLTREEVRTFYKAKGPENILLVSDLTRLAGLPPGTYEDFGQEVVMTEEGAIMVPGENVLAGASFLITRGVENMMAFTGCTLGQAIDLATRNPARVLRLNDRGELAPGKRADVILFRLEDGKMEVVKTYLTGDLVFEKKLE